MIKRLDGVMEYWNGSSPEMWGLKWTADLSDSNTVVVGSIGLPYEQWVRWMPRTTDHPSYRPTKLPTLEEALQVAKDSHA